MRTEKTFSGRAARSELVVWSSLEDYELETYLTTLCEAFPEISVALTRTPTGELADRLRRRDLGERPPQLIFGTAATVLAEPVIGELLEPVTISAAPATGSRARWVAASGFRNAVAACGAALAGRGLPVPRSWAMLAEPRYRGAIAFPDPALSGAGTLALAALIQRLGPDAAWPVIAGIKRNAARLIASSWSCAKAALEPATPIAVSVEIACRRLADQEPAIQVVVPEDASAVEFEGFAMLAGAAHPALCRDVLAWSVGPASQAIARRWRKVTLDRSETARSDLSALGSFALDHEQAARQRAALVERFAALEGPTP
ncbi:MAG TPA: ABC transporter substrate-binding protein [Kofleriaceae bacterium]|jgi:iron(III) transport system substrate-binding protein|nr:ABC transporter substrate-binding protein [Kofleriaceae bacterium]